MTSTTAPPPVDLDGVVSLACAEAGFPARDRHLLRHFANAVYLVRDVPVVVRVAYGPDAASRSRLAVAATRWLGANSFPATLPAALPALRAQPILPTGRRDVAVTFWDYHPQPEPARPPEVESLAYVARLLHKIDAAAPVRLPRYRPLVPLRLALAEPDAPGVLGGGTHRWLLARVDELCGAFDALDFPLGVGVIHADLYLGNLLWSGDGDVVLADWDSVSVGPREVDLAPTYAAVRFGLPAATVDRFAGAYGYDLRCWPGFPALREMRELSTLTALVRLAAHDPASAAELHHRVETLRCGDTATRWHSR